MDTIAVDKPGMYTNLLVGMVQHCTVSTRLSYFPYIVKILLIMYTVSSLFKQCSARWGHGFPLQY